MDKMKTFFSGDTYTVSYRGYIIHLSRDVAYESEAVVEDMDGNRVHFLEAVMERYIHE